MSGIFNLDAPIWVFMGEVADIIILALLWWCCCLGIVTIGASTTALFYVLGKKIRKEQTYVAKDFFKSFGQNFRQSVPVSILLTIAFISLGMYVSFIIEGVSTSQPPTYLKYIVPITILFAFEVINVNTYTWALLSRFEMKTKAIIKSAFIMTHRHLLTTLANLGVIVAAALCMIKFPLAIVVAPGAIVWGQSFMIQKVFTGYIEIAQAEKATVEDETLEEARYEEIPEKAVVEETSIVTENEE